MNNLMKKTTVLTSSALLLAMICGSSTANGSEVEKKPNFFQKLFPKKKDQPTHDDEVEKAIRESEKTLKASEKLRRSVEAQNAEIEMHEKRNKELRAQLNQSLSDFDESARGKKVVSQPSTPQTTPSFEKRNSKTLYDEEVEKVSKESEKKFRELVEKVDFANKEKKKASDNLQKAQEQYDAAKKNLDQFTLEFQGKMDQIEKKRRSSTD